MTHTDRDTKAPAGYCDTVFLSFILPKVAVLIHMNTDCDLRGNKTSVFIGKTCNSGKKVEWLIYAREWKPAYCLCLGECNRHNYEFCVFVQLILYVSQTIYVDWVWQMKMYLVHEARCWKLTLKPLVRCLVEKGIFYSSQPFQICTSRLVPVHISLNLKGFRILTYDKLMALGYTLFVFDLLEIRVCLPCHWRSLW